MTLLAPQKTRTTIVRTLFRLLLGAFLLLAGISHLTVNREAFLAQVPTWLPLEGDFVVVASGIVEMVLGAALLALGRYRVQVGWITAAFFVAIFPGNISQLVTQTDSFGLNTDLARTIRLLFQPVLVLWALWSTGAWKALRAHRAGRTDPNGAGGQGTDRRGTGQQGTGPQGAQGTNPQRTDPQG